MAPFSLHLFNQGLCYSSREISLEVDGLRKFCLYCLKVLILVQFLLKKISAGSHIVLTGERLNNAENSSFHETPFWVTQTGGLVTSFIVSSYGSKDTIK